MNMTNSFSYVNAKYTANVALMGGETLGTLYASDTELGRWLRTKNFIETIGRNLFVHGGISPQVAAIKARYSLNGLNEVTRTKINGQTCSGDCSDMNHGTWGVYWYRDMANNVLTQAQVDGILATFGVSRIIIGHTILNSTAFSLLYNQKVFGIDTSIASNYSANGYIKGLVFNPTSGFSTLNATAATQTSATFGTNQSPTCSITSPTSATTFTAPTSVTISAGSEDSDGTVAKVEFFQGTTKLGQATTSPYSYTWTGIAAGPYSLTVKATDNQGAVTTSSAVSIIVNSATGLNLAENSTEKKMVIYPNPISGEINLELNAGKSSISIYNLGGKQLFNLKTSNLTEVINVNDLNNGIYILEIIQNNSRKSFKLVKNK
jgi:hypothetical protein